MEPVTLKGNVFRGIPELAIWLLLFSEVVPLGGMERLLYQAYEKVQVKPEFSQRRP